MSSWLSGKRVLLTGGAGAFGRAFLRWAQGQAAKQVTVLSRDEMKHAALRREVSSDAGMRAMVRLAIGDICAPETLQPWLRDADCVVHAAAMKHVGECEQNVLASTRVNVVGTANVVSAFLQSDCRALVFLSTDKSPYSSSAYGAQKYLGERMVVEAARLCRPEQRAFCLRYSNVMDSTGSVFHIFRDLLRAGKTATVNGAATSRGFVTQAQVLACLHQGLASAAGGEVFVLRPQVVRIAELAEAMRDLLRQGGGPASATVGSVQVLESAMYQGEKESATLIMAEELGLARPFQAAAATDPSSQVVMLDNLGRHPPGTLPLPLPSHGLQLSDCPTLSGAALQAFVQPLLATT